MYVMWFTQENVLTGLKNCWLSLKIFFEKVDFENISRQQKCMQNYPAVIEEAHKVHNKSPDP